MHRAFRAHLTLLEQFLPFAIAVLIAHLAGVSNAATVGAAAPSFWLRVGHAVWVIRGFPTLTVQPLIFTAGWICILVTLIAVLSD